ncbi:unnamed protein product [Oikopleura dioica]|uniref:protein-tyrosine-phosphatase n=2 Tax=Oikopleura dioica TaxID=34765 RepID=E4XBX2_OIKDI|nr:unnamed protein product [Oikopleura dioica]
MDNEVFSLSVKFLTGTFVDFDFNKKSSGDELLTRCKAFHGITEYPHFGLQLESGVWLAKEKTIERQLKREYGSLSRCQFTAKLRIRFWPRYLKKCKSPDLQTYLFLQLKCDIANDCLIVTDAERDAILVKMGALQQQVDYGDVPGENHLCNDKAFMSKSLKHHQKFCGMGRNEATEKFLSLAQQLTFYGVETFPVQMSNVNFYIGLHCQGYYLWNSNEYKNANCGQFFKWNKIKEFRYRDKIFSIKFKKNADIPHQKFQFASFTRARSLFSSMMDYHIFYRTKTERDIPIAHALKKEKALATNSVTNLTKSPAGSQEYILKSENQGNSVQVDGQKKENLRSPRLGVSHQIFSPDDPHPTFETDPFTPLTELSNSLQPDNIGKNQWEYTIRPNSRGDFGFQFYGGIDQGLNPTVTSADYGLLPGDILQSVNGVPIQEHTYNQIKESINSSVVLDRLKVVVFRESKNFQESLKAIKEGLLSGSLVRQFERIPILRQDLSRATSLRRGNEAKNRYRDVLPYDDTRVKLSNSSYINASWIDIHTGSFHRQWIAAQGPLDNTICDFWKCVWETDVTSIIMLCKVVECMQDKCAQYWPTELFMAEEYDSIDVLMEEEEFLEYAVKRVFLLCHNSGKSRKVCHWQYTDWPDHGVPR